MRDAPHIASKVVGGCLFPMKVPTQPMASNHMLNPSLAFATHASAPNSDP